MNNGEDVIDVEGAYEDDDEDEDDDDDEDDSDSCTCHHDRARERAGELFRRACSLYRYSPRITPTSRP